MGTTDLAINDIVLYKGRAYRVFGLLGHIDIVTLAPVVARGDDGMIYGPTGARGEDIEPCILTPEILKNTGFRWGLTTDQEDMLSAGLGVPVTVQKSWVYEDEEGGVVCVNFPTETDWGMVYCKNDHFSTSYSWDTEIGVHNFQQTLRSCCLYELADAIKLVSD